MKESMGPSEEDFLEELRRDFALEAEEYLHVVASGLIALEKNPSASEDVMETVFRAAHSLKGAAHAVQMSSVATLCQSMESVFSGVKKGMFQLAGEDFDILQRTVDAVSGMISGDDDGQSGKLLKELDRIAESRTSPLARSGEGNAEGAPRRLVVGSGRAEASEIRGDVSTPESSERRESREDLREEDEAAWRADSCESGARVEREPGVQDEGPIGISAKGTSGRAFQDTIRISAAKLDSLLLRAEELISVKLSLEQRMSEMEEVLSFFALTKDEWEKSAMLSRDADLQNAVQIAKLRKFFESSRGNLLETEERLRRLEKALRADHRMTGTLVKSLLEGTRMVLMLPFSNLLQGFPKMVRDLARELGKDVDIEIRGGEISVDKRILEGIKDPLIHLVRNAVDHGIEKPTVRNGRGKPPRGTIAIDISRMEGNRVEVLVSDDGGGINAGKLRESAVKAGILTPQEAEGLDDRSALLLVFRSGLSTSPIITDISGRGLGMAIVLEGVEKMGGKVSVESSPEKGTLFRISLPLTLATFRGVLVREAGHLFVVPTSNVDRVARTSRSRIKKVEGRDAVTLDGAPLSLVRLGAVLGLAAQREEGASNKVVLLVLSAGKTSIAFSVDQVLQEQEVLLKNLGPQLLRVRNVAGATVLGSGEVVPVLNVADLVRTAVRGGRSGFGESQVAASTIKGAGKRKAVLLAEDSITSRTLLKNILTAAGYDVHAVVDGAEAWSALAEKTCDIVISDVEMPRMNGFDLTARIRSDPRSAHLPVVLVTSLESREDRERGVEAGANAYIVKSGFDQENLLEVLRRLI